MGRIETLQPHRRRRRFFVFAVLIILSRVAMYRVREKRDVVAKKISTDAVANFVASDAAASEEAEEVDRLRASPLRTDDRPVGKEKTFESMRALFEEALRRNRTETLFKAFFKSQLGGKDKLSAAKVEQAVDVIENDRNMSSDNSTHTSSVSLEVLNESSGTSTPSGFACPMEWLRQPTHIPADLEYFPRVFFNECVHDYDEIISKILMAPKAEQTHERDSGNVSDGQRNAPFRIPDRLTLGKYTNFATTFFMHAAFSGQYPRGINIEVASTSPAESIWAKHLDCTPNASEWECLYGARHSKGVYRSEGEIEHQSFSKNEEHRIANELWMGRTQHFDDSTVLIVAGWISRLAIPLNACENNRNCIDIPTRFVQNIARTKSPVYLSLHVRMGDACDQRVNERPAFTGDIWRTGRRSCVLPIAYGPILRSMQERYNVTDILLATDSQEVIDWAVNTTNYNWHFLDFDRGRLGRSDKGWIEYRTDIGRIETESALMDIELLSKGHVFVGGLCSHFSLSVLWSMIGRRNAVIPYASMDGCSLRNSRAANASSSKTLFDELFDFALNFMCYASRFMPGSTRARNGCHTHEGAFLSTR